MTGKWYEWKTVETELERFGFFKLSIYPWQLGRFKFEHDYRLSPNPVTIRFKPSRRLAQALTALQKHACDWMVTWVSADWFNYVMEHPNRKISSPKELHGTT